MATLKPAHPIRVASRNARLGTDKDADVVVIGLQMNGYTVVACGLIIYQTN